MIHFNPVCFFSVAVYLKMCSDWLKRGLVDHVMANQMHRYIRNAYRIEICNAVQKEDSLIFNLAIDKIVPLLS